MAPPAHDWDGGVAKRVSPPGNVSVVPVLRHEVLSSWVREHQVALQAAALRRCRNSSDADDLVQETFEVAFLHAEQLRRANNPRSWLLTLLHRRFINRYLHRKQTSGPDLADVEDVLSSAVAEAEPPWASISTEDVWAASRRLDPGLRQVLELYEGQGLSYKEIAQSLQIPVSTVGTQINRSRRKLRALLTPK